MKIDESLIRNAAQSAYDKYGNRSIPTCVFEIIIAGLLEIARQVASQGDDHDK